MCWNLAYAILMFFSSFVTFLSGLLIEKSQKKSSKQRSGKGWVAVSFVINLSILFWFKYITFLFTDFFTAVQAVFPEITMSKPTLSILLPVGISFYTFQALSYTMDVYRGQVQVERNLLRYCVFVSFFPQLVAGPIERSSNLLSQFYVEHKFEFERVKNGLILMAWGYFVKLVIADRSAILVDEVFDHYKSYAGFQLVLAAVLFGIQIYCDFSGYSYIAIGAAQVMGFQLMDNFKTPYLSRSVAEFWRRWHISLSTWFRDYLYFPLGGSRCQKSKRYRNLMIVFLTSGLWHGAGWTFIIWGGLNGLFQIIGMELKPIKQWYYKKFRIQEKAFSHVLLQVLMTFALVDFAWIFFRADTLQHAVGYMIRMFTTLDATNLFAGALFNIGLDASELRILLVSLLILLGTSLLHYKGIKIRETLAKQGIWFRYLVCLGLIFYVLIFGIYGSVSSASQFIYFQF